MEYFISTAGDRSGPHSQFQIIEKIRDGGLKGEELGTMEEVASLAEAQALIARTIAIIGAADADQMDDAAATTVVMNLPNGMVFSLSGADYVRDWSLPQFYFHLMASYALLRQSGVAIGKADYVPHMARYAVRP